MWEYINSDFNTFRCKDNPIFVSAMSFWVLWLGLFIIKYDIFFDYIVPFIIFTLFTIFCAINFVNNRRSWLQLTSSSIILRTSKKLVWFKMETIEIPYQDVQLIRSNQIITKIGTSETLQIKCKGKNKTIGFPMLDDMFRFEQEMKSRWININRNMDDDEFQQELSRIKRMNTDVKKIKYEAYSSDMSNQFDWITFYWWVWFLTVLFFWFLVGATAIVAWFYKSWLLDSQTNLLLCLSPITFICLIFAYTCYIRKKSYIKIYPSSIFVKKYKILSAQTYEIYLWEIEYVNIELTWLTYSVHFKIKDQEEKIFLSHIKDWDKLEDRLNSIWIITSNGIWEISNHKLWCNTWITDQYLQFNKITPNLYKNWNKYYCKRGFTINTHVWTVIYIIVNVLCFLCVWFVGRYPKLLKISLISIFSIVLYLIIISIIWWRKSFAELDENEIKINRLSWFIPKMTETIVRYEEIEKAVVNKLRKHPWYSVCLYLKTYMSYKKNYIYFNVDDWKSLKNELKWRWVNVKFDSRWIILPWQK